MHHPKQGGRDRTVTPKTATTTLQKHVFPHLSEIQYIGKFPGTPDELQGILYALLRYRSADCLDLRDQLTKRAIEILRRYIAEAAKPILISNENVLAETLRPRLKCGSHGSVLPARTTLHQLKYLADLIGEAGGGTPRVVITLRGQSEFLPSFYAEAYQATFGGIGSMSAFSGYIDQLLDGAARLIDPGSLNFCQIEDACNQVFGSGNTQFLMYRWFDEEKMRVSIELAQFIGCDCGEVHRLLDLAPRENIRRTAGLKKTFRSDRRHLGLHLSALKRNIIPNHNLGFGRVLLRVLRKIKYGLSEVCPHQDDLRKVQDFYRSSNEEFLRRHPEFRCVRR